MQHKTDKKDTIKTRVLIVDDHQMYREGLKAVINYQADMDVVGLSENGEEAVVMTRDLLPDVILMDVKMPVMDGAAATRRILAEMPSMRILALSMYNDKGYMGDMIRAGALGYILKGCDSEELSEAIRKVAGSRRT